MHDKLGHVLLGSIGIHCLINLQRNGMWVVAFKLPALFHNTITKGLPGLTQLVVSTTNRQDGYGTTRYLNSLKLFGVGFGGCVILLSIVLYDQGRVAAELSKYRPKISSCSDVAAQPDDVLFRRPKNFRKVGPISL